MKRVAFFSPLPPETSGIADYSAELIPALAEHFDLDLFAAGDKTTDSFLREHFTLRAYEDFSARDHAAPYDAVLYQIGNSAAHHGAIYRQLLARPGVVVLHEFMLHNLVRDLAVAGPGRAGFVEVMRYCYGATGSAMAGRLLHANNLPEMWSYPLFEQVADAAQGLIVHNQCTRDRVLASRPTASIHVVPSPLSLHGFGSPDREERRSLLARHGCDESAFVVASFGHLTASKHLDVSLEAFARFRGSHPDAVYLLVGEVSEAYSELSDMLAGEHGHGVVTTGRLALEDFLRHMTHCDVALNLRSPTGGETSATCLRLLGLGRPTVVSDAGWFSEIPAGCCARVATGASEAREIAALLSALAGDEVLRDSLGRNAARWAAAHHRLEDVALGYAEAVARAIEHPGAYSATAPLTPPPHDMTATLIAEITSGLGDLGLTEEDQEAQRAIAETLVDLGLDRAGSAP